MWSFSPVAEEHLWSGYAIGSQFLSASLEFEYQPPSMIGSSTEDFPVFTLHPALFIKRTFTAGPGSLSTMTPYISCGGAHTHIFLKWTGTSLLEVVRCRTPEYVS